MTGAAQLDHLVIAARTLEDGVRWCEATLGVVPTAGGTHPLMSTHNRVMSIATAQFPRVYLEIIAIDPAAPALGHTRWFDLDDADLQKAISRQPRLIHFAGRGEQVASAVSALREHGIDRGPLLAVERATPQGMLRWQITVRPDGQRLFDGALPTLIQWEDIHPADSMADSGLALQSFEITHPQHVALAAAFTLIGLEGISVGAGQPNLKATLDTPKGRVVLESAGA
jgi:hypothetical protein